MGIPAVVAAGDRGAAKAVRGESKVFLEIEGRPLVAWVVECLQRVPEVSEIFVVGDAPRLARVLARPESAATLAKPLHLVPQQRNLLENLWQGYRSALPGAGAEGRDPQPQDEQVQVLYLSGDLPFATPEEISQFVQRSLAARCDYALGLVGEEAMEGFFPAAPGEPGIRMATFNLREGRFRQSNLHLVRPGRLRNRELIEEMYERRHQREFWPVLSLALRVLSRGGLAMLWYFALMHLAGLADRRGWRALADRMRRWIPLGRIERACGRLLGTDFRFVVTEVGGCAIDIDTEPDYDAALARFRAWREAQALRAQRLSRALAAGSGESAERRA
jgi:molybdopterin-guanine dinucleotide biosynthesis protein A